MKRDNIVLKITFGHFFAGGTERLKQVSLYKLFFGGLFGLFIGWPINFIVAIVVLSGGLIFGYYPTTWKINKLFDMKKYQFVKIGDIRVTPVSLLGLIFAVYCISTAFGFIFDENTGIQLDYLKQTPTTLQSCAALFGVAIIIVITIVLCLLIVLVLSVFFTIFVVSIIDILIALRKYPIIKIE